MRNSLTDSRIKTLQAKEKPYKAADGGGLYLEIKPNGKKYWKLKYRFAGQEKKLSIGTYGSAGGEVSLKAARVAMEDAKNLLQQGIDPGLQKQLRKGMTEDQQANSFAAIALEWYAKQATSWAPATAKRNMAMLDKDILPYLGKRPVADLETFELVGCLTRISDRGAIETAHKARQVINQVCRYAKQTGRAKHNPASDLTGTLQPRQVNHMAALTNPKDFGRLLVAIDGYSGTHIIRTALALAPLLFQRPGELCGMEWSEVDLEQALWTIPREKKKERNKTEGDHIVPLSRQALALLADIQPLTGHGRYVFPNQRNHQTPIRTESLNKALRTLGYDTAEQQCAHGFRACARTMLDEQLQLRIEWIEHQLAHKVRDTLGNAYNRTKHLPERVQMMQRWADYLDNLKRQELAGNVVTGRVLRA
jgi:integrase